MKPIPILFYSDAPDQPTGLGRITKDLASLTAQLPEFRVGTFGKYGRGSSQLPFTQYTFQHQWGEDLIEEVWKDFSGGDNGIIFTIWDVSRLTWFLNPMMDGPLHSFLNSGRFQRWGYIPVDSLGPDDAMTGECRDALSRYDRALAYTIFGKRILHNCGRTDADWLPHGINSTVFQPRDRQASRLAGGVTSKEDVVVGCMMTNQARKDWGTAFATAALLKQQLGARFKFWIHVDDMTRYWNIYALINDFHLADCVRVTLNGQFNSEQLSYWYSGCDATFLPSLGEGFGYPIVESLACGVPCIHGDYAGGAELIPKTDWLVTPTTFRLDGRWNQVRPVWNPEIWAETILETLNGSTEEGAGSVQATCTQAVRHLDWTILWPAAWKKWMLEGIR